MFVTFVLEMVSHPITVHINNTIVCMESLKAVHVRSYNSTGVMLYIILNN